MEFNRASWVLALAAGYLFTPSVGAQTTASVGNLVWEDYNGNGVRDAGEPGLAGYVVELLVGDAVVATTTTDGGGGYGFTGLAAGTYVVRVNLVATASPGGIYNPNQLSNFLASTANAPTSFDPTNATDNDDNGVVSVLEVPGADETDVNLKTFIVATVPFAVGSGDNPRVDFGLRRRKVALGDVVWLDANDNGVRDAGEPGIPGARVRLLYADGSPVNTPPSMTDPTIEDRITDADGHYHFPSLFTDSYRVQVQVPPGFTSSTDIASSAAPDNDVDNDDNGVDASTLDGLPAVTSGVITLTLLNVPPGSGNPGEPIADDGNDRTNLTVDFGFHRADTVSLGNRVWNDTPNQNGVIDGGEVGVGGVTVRLYRAAETTPFRTTITAADGTYLFSGLAPGEYAAEVVLPPGFISTTDIGSSALPNGDVDSDDNGVVLGTGTVRSHPITLTVGGEPIADGDASADSNLTLDFGMCQPTPPLMSLGNLVWLDDTGVPGADAPIRPSDDNGLFNPEAGEQGIAGVTVRLVAADGTTVLASTVTDAAGQYRFAGLPDGRYLVEVQNPAAPAGGSIFSSSNLPTTANPDNDIDNDENGEVETPPVTRSGLIELRGGTEPTNDGDTDAQTNLTVDFGFRLEARATPVSVAIGNLVWLDDTGAIGAEDRATDNNGRFDAAAGERGLSGVFVALYDATGATVLNTTTTDADGYYLFTTTAGGAPLPEGTYLVHVVPPPLHTSSRDIGTSPAADADVDNDDNGVDFVAGAVRSRVVTLIAGSEPVSDGDGDPNSNLTVDFGFKSDQFLAPCDPFDPLCDAGLSVGYAGFDQFFEVTGAGVSTVPTPGPLTVVYVLPDSLENHMWPFGTGWACDVDGQVVACTHEAGLDVGQTASFTVWTGELRPGPVTATAALDIIGDKNLGNNVASVNIPSGDRGDGADVALTGRVLSPANPTAGGLVTYRLTIGNEGPGLATSVAFVHVLRPGLAFDSLASDVGTCARPRAGSLLVRCALGTLPPGAEAHVDLTVRAASASLFEPAFFAFSANDFDANLGNNAVRLETAVVAAGGLMTLGPVDTDNDSMPDSWEEAMGLDPLQADAQADADGDGASNFDELGAGTHPLGRFASYFAEGVNNPSFETTYALQTVDTRPARVLLRFLSPDGSQTAFCQIVGGLGRATVSSADVFGGARAEFATVVESDVPLVVERTTTWGNGAGSHSASYIPSPRTTWYFAEGTTLGGMQLFYLVENAAATPAAITVTYLRELPDAPVAQAYTVAPHSRLTIWANLVPGLESASASAVIQSTNGVPVTAERTMYRDAAGEVWGAGHAAEGIAQPSLRWEFGEGATGDYFDMFLLLANPSANASHVTATYRLTDGQTAVRQYEVAPWARRTVWVDLEGAELGNTSMGVTIAVDNGVPVVAERVMWWPGGPSTWLEAHVSPGATDAGPRWAVAGGEDGGARDAETYVLVTNTGASGGTVRVTLAIETGQTMSRDLTIGGNARFTVDVRSMFPEAAGRRFGVIVESVGTSLPLIVERSTYASSALQRWAAGANVRGTRLP